MVKFIDYLAESTKDLYNYIGKNSAKFKQLESSTKNITQSAKDYHEKAFPEGQNHLEFDLPHEAPESVKQHIESNGGKLHPSGHSVTLKSGREVPTSKFLGKSRAPKHVETDYQHYARNAADSGNTKLVISRHPGEVASASTGTHWDSCANLAHDYSESPAASMMHKELEHGTMIGMHVHKDAPKNADGEYDAKHVLGRVLIKKHQDESGKTHYYPEGKTYGKFPKSAMDKVNDFVEKHNPKDWIFAQKNDNVYDDDDSSVKVNKNADVKKLKTIYPSTNIDLKLKVAGNKNTPSEILDHIANNEKNAIVLSRAAKNPNMPKHQLDKLINHESESVSGDAHSNPSLSSDEIHELYKKSKKSDHKITGIMYNPSTGKNTLDEIIKIKKENKPAYIDAFKHPNISQRHISDAIEGKHGYGAMYNATSNPNISKENIFKAIDSDSGTAASNALSSKNATDEHFAHALNKDNIASIYHSAIHNPNISKEMLRKYAQHEDDDVASDAKHAYRTRFK